MCDYEELYENDAPVINYIQYKIYNKQAHSTSIDFAF